MDPWGLCKQNIPANAEKKEYDDIASNQGRVFAIFGIGKKGIGRDKFFMWFVVTCKRYIHFYQISGNGNSPIDYIHVYTGVLGREIIYAKFLSEGVVCIIDEEYAINLFYTEDIFLSYIDKKNLPKVEALGKAFLESQQEPTTSIHHNKKNWEKSITQKLQKLESILESKLEDSTPPDDDPTEPNFLLEKRYSLEGPPQTKEIILTSDVVNIVDQNYWLISKKGWMYIKDRSKYLEFHVQGVREYFSDLLERKSYSFCLNILDSMYERNFTRLRDLYVDFPGRRELNMQCLLNPVGIKAALERLLAHKLKKYLEKTVSALSQEIVDLVRDGPAQLHTATGIMGLVILVLCKFKRQDLLFKEFKSTITSNSLLVDSFGQYVLGFYEKGWIPEFPAEMMADLGRTFENTLKGERQKGSFIYLAFKKYTENFRGPSDKETTYLFKMA
jgi:hypothetical protein